MIQIDEAKTMGDPKKHLITNYNVVVNFREPDENNCMYVGAYRYVSKEDPEVFHSPGHLPLDKIKNSRTNQCVQAHIKKRESVSATNPVEQPNESKMKQNQKRRKTMPNFELYDFIVKHNVRSEKELHALANQHRADGEQDLAEHVTKFPKKINENISSAWKLHNAVERVKIAATESCVPTCNGQLYECATQVLRKK